jgi:hypothetical protein
MWRKADLSLHLTIRQLCGHSGHSASERDEEIALRIEQRNISAVIK